MFLKSSNVREAKTGEKSFVRWKIFMNDIEFKEGHFCELELINKFYPGAHVENIFGSPIDWKRKI